jgi:hypothetical protein
MNTIKLASLTDKLKDDEPFSTIEELCEILQKDDLLAQSFCSLFHGHDFFIEAQRGIGENAGNSAFNLYKAISKIKTNYDNCDNKEDEMKGLKFMLSHTRELIAIYKAPTMKLDKDKQEAYIHKTIKAAIEKINETDYYINSSYSNYIENRAEPLLYCLGIERESNYNRLQGKFQSLAQALTIQNRLDARQREIIRKYLYDCKLESKPEVILGALAEQFHFAIKCHIYNPTSRHIEILINEHNRKKDRCWFGNPNNKSNLRFEVGYYKGHYFYYYDGFALSFLCKVEDELEMWQRVTDKKYIYNISLLVGDLSTNSKMRLNTMKLIMDLDNKKAFKTLANEDRLVNTLQYKDNRDDNICFLDAKALTENPVLTKITSYNMKMSRSKLPPEQIQEILKHDELPFV